MHADADKHHEFPLAFLLNFNIICMHKYKQKKKVTKCSLKSPSQGIVNSFLYTNLKIA